LQNLVTIQGDRCADTGTRYYYTDKRGNQSETAKYLVLLVGDKIMIVKAGMSAPVNDTNRRGVLDKVPSDVQQRIIAPGEMDFNRNRDKWGGRVPTYMPVMLDTTITKTKGFIALAVLIPLGLLNVANIFKAMSRFGNPQNHPIARRLLKYGDPEEVAQKIEDEYHSDDVQVVGPVTFTRSWMIRPTTFGVDAMFLGDSAWSYKTVTQHYTNGVPTGKTYTANLCDIHGTQFSVQLKSEALTDEFVVAVAHRVPWVLAGFVPDIEKLWKKDKPKLYEIVEDRRKDFAEHIRQQREAPEAAAEPDGEEPMDVEPA
jgi:hypothetical protein